MPRFSQRSRDNLDTCHKDLQILFAHVIHYYDCSVICGHRNEGDQNEAYNSGNSKVKWPNSKHNLQPSMAVDVVPYPLDWNDIEEFNYFGGYVQAVADLLHYEGYMQHRLKWGGHFDSFFDGPHFELIED